MSLLLTCQIGFWPCLPLFERLTHSFILLWSNLFIHSFIHSLIQFSLLFAILQLAHPSMFSPLKIHPSTHSSIFLPTPSMDSRFVSTLRHPSNLSFVHLNHLCINPSIMHPPSTHLYIHSSIHFSIDPNPSIHLFIHLSFHQFMHPFCYPSIHP